jgi:hypothetical protein
MKKKVTRRKLTEGKEERRPSPVAPISRSVSSVPFSLDLADVNNRTRIVAKIATHLYQGNPVNVLRIYFKLEKFRVRAESTIEPCP